MTPVHRPAIFSGIVLSATLAVASTVAAQDRVDSRNPGRVVNPRTLEVGIYLQLHGHPDTAHRGIEVQVRGDRVELHGLVMNELERATAERLASLVSSGMTIENRLRVRPGTVPVRTQVADSVSSDDLEKRFLVRLAQAFPEEILNRVKLTVYPVALSPLVIEASPEPRPQPPLEETAWVVVLEGVVPSVRDQLAMNDMLLHGPVPAAAVLNRTYAAHMPGISRVRTDTGRGLQVRVPFIGLGFDLDEGIDLDLSTSVLPVRVWTGGVRTVGKYVPADDEKLVDDLMAAVRADDELRNVQLRASAIARVLTIEGKLTAADKMRVVALARKTEGVRGIVDRTATISGGPAFHHEQDLSAYLGYRLGEHAGAWDIETAGDSSGRIRIRARVATAFHSELAAVVIAHDPAISTLPLEPKFTEWDASVARTVRR